MPFADFESLLASRLGFDTRTVGIDAVQQVIGRCMEDAGVSDAGAYLQSLLSSSEAWESFVDQVVVPETWFFRDRAPFELAAELAGARVARGPGRPFRVLSCPCSTGEEPYSLAIALLEAGIPAERFTIDAVDVSARAIDAARRATFRMRSFRGSDVSYRDRYFDETEGQPSWRVHERVRAAVRFQQGNVLADGFLQADAPYDLVFCRNLLIYLHEQARALALTTLIRRLDEDGVLVLGHAEAFLAREFGMPTFGRPRTFSFTKPGPRPAAAPRPAAKATLPPPIVPIPSVTRTASAGTAESLLLDATRLADQGRLDEAVRHCDEHLRIAPDSADGHFLMGVLHEAGGRPERAEGAFRKALYLDPTHRGALLHLALSKERRGDERGAALLRDRGRRARDISTPE